MADTLLSNLPLATAALASTDFVLIDTGSPPITKRATMAQVQTFTGGGSVTSASVVSANGFAGTVATATTTPAITVSTTVTGVLKGNGTSISAAVNSDLPAMTATVGGAVPTPPNNTTTFLRGDGTFATPSSGTGTVTHTAGNLTANAIVLGNAVADITVLGSLGTTTTLLHGNAAGAPTFGSVSLTADVSGILPSANGGTGVNNASTITLGGNLTTSGAFTTTFTATGTTAVTLPTSGTLLGTAAAVTAAQGGTGLSTLTANNVILGNGTGNVLFVAPSTSGNVLTSNGSTWQSTAPAGGSALTLLSTVTASTSATVDIETTFSSTYDAYMIVCSGVTFSGTGITLRGRLKQSGSYVTTANYYFISNRASSLSASYTGTGGEAATSAAITGAVLDNVGASSLDMVCYLFNPTNTSFGTPVICTGESWDGTNAHLYMFQTSFSLPGGAAASTGIRFYPDSGTVVAGKFRLYGITNT